MDVSDCNFSTSELIQLLGRDEHEIDLFRSGEALTGKRVLITGAAGSIGSTLSRAVAAVSPASITVFDHDEYGLYRIRNSIEELQPKLNMKVVLGDVRDRARLHSVFAKEKPEIVFHVAALKHVGLVEENPSEGAATNVLGTRNLAEICEEFSTEAMVLISTDKAVCPHNIMGATKKMAELVCREKDLTSNGNTRFIVVRFGNVFGSSGSVVPLFQHQIAHKRSVTITDPKAERYFMTEREAVALLLEALQLGLSNEEAPGSVYLQDMGQRVSISDLAKRMIRAMGKLPDVDVPIVITGLRPGEKVFENLHEPGEIVTATGNTRISKARSSFDAGALKAGLDGLDAACRLGDEEATLKILDRWMDRSHSQTATDSADVHQISEHMVKS